MSPSREFSRALTESVGMKADLGDPCERIRLQIVAFDPVAKGLGSEKQPGAFAVFVSQSRDTPGAGLREGIGPDLQTMYLRNRQMPELFRIPKSHKSIQADRQ